ncbi:spore coat protein GerQ [Cohnella thermotolerans]|uniref:spore coat protein GerQ n=1 Tax=Cohnella thermotolerans TaxID=329858 RepID=UPI0003F5378E
MYNNVQWPQAQVNPASFGGVPTNAQMPAGTLQSSPFATAVPMMPQMVTGNVFPVAQATTMTPPPATSGSIVTPSGMTFPPLPKEESYVENILRMNLGKVGTFYMTYENNSEWNAKIFKGVIEAAGRDHIIISDPVTGRRFLLLTLNLDYVTFDEPLTYSLPFGSMGSTRSR